MRDRLLIRVEASEKVGMGHAVRCMAIGQAWQHLGGSALLLSTSPESIFRSHPYFQGLAFASLPAGSPGDPTSCIRAGLDQGALGVLLDDYGCGPEWHRAFTQAGLPLACMDDMGHWSSYEVCAVINASPAAHSDMYPRRSPGTHLLLGTDFSPLGPPFWDPPAPREDHHPLRLLLTMGGSDPGGWTPRLVPLMDKLPGDWEAHVVLGPMAPPWETTLGPSPRWTFLRNPPMAEALRNADLVISAAGGTALEGAALGLPMVLIQTAANQAGVAAAFATADAAWVITPSPDLDPTALLTVLQEALSLPDARRRRALRASALVNGRGALRIASNLRDCFVSERAGTAHGSHP